MPDNYVVMLFSPLAMMEPIRGLKPDACSLKVDEQEDLDFHVYWLE